MKVGFIGVGNMGGPMCRNIVKRSNHQVTVFDLNAAALKTCTDLGATAAKSIAEVTKGADVVMTSLPMPKDVEAVTLGDNGILANIGKGQTYIDLSTNAPSMVKKIGAAMAAKGIAMLDAPVSGGTVGRRSRDHRHHGGRRQEGVRRRAAGAAVVQRQRDPHGRARHRHGGQAGQQHVGVLQRRGRSPRA